MEGTITLWDNGKLRGDPPDNKLVEYAMRCGVYICYPDGSDEIVSPLKDPEKWLRNLWREIRGYTCWASDAEEVKK
jgi:hypothetical protein